MDHGSEILPARTSNVGSMTVRRALPQRTRRTVGAWCFVDHMGPVAIGSTAPAGVGVHPHIGLQTVTWLRAGELLHRDSLGSEQVIRPGQVNLMTAGRGVAHAEEPTASRGDLHGVQFWIAQPEHARHGAPAFAHHAALPVVTLGHAEVTVLAGTCAGVRAPAEVATELVGIDLALRRGTTVVPLDERFEHALVVLEGAVRVRGLDDAVITPGRLAYLGLGAAEVALEVGEDAAAVLVGGVPFEAPVTMWWNFVGRTRPEIETARADWAAAAPRFGALVSPLGRIDAPELPWASGR